MKIEDVTKAAVMVQDLQRLEAWLKESWYSSDNNCRLVFHTKGSTNHMVEVPMTPVRVAVSGEIKELYAALAKMGVAVKTP